MSENPTPRSITWYRSPIDSKILKGLHERSDWLGFLQTCGYLGIVIFTGTAAYVAVGRLPIAVVVLLFLLHGVCCSFMPAAVHELCHGTVFKTKALNAVFVRVFSFLTWTNFEIFDASHARHHRYTLHAPDDLEVVLPMKLMVKYFFLYGIVSPFGDTFGRGVYANVKTTIRIARGKFSGEWEQALFPESEPEKRRPAVNWARTMLVGHGLILAISIYFKLWLIPVLVSFSTCYGGGLLLLLNNAQHIGLQDDVPDFRLCCRTIILNPVLGFLYWHMNYHTEHHMYAAVPCYRLGRVHALIKHDMPECPRGVIATWRQIYSILKLQKKNPAYQYAAPLPSQTAAGGSRALIARPL
jgi:fatty acid desaturase